MDAQGMSKGKQVESILKIMSGVSPELFDAVFTSATEDKIKEVGPAGLNGLEFLRIILMMHTKDILKEPADVKKAVAISTVMVQVAQSVGDEALVNKVFKNALDAVNQRIDEIKNPKVTGQGKPILDEAKAQPGQVGLDTLIKLIAGEEDKDAD